MERGPGQYELLAQNYSDYSDGYSLYLDLTLLVNPFKAHKVGMCFGEENLGGYNSWV